MIFSSLKEYEGMKPGLSRIKAFLKYHGDPQNKLKCIHIAGTNGKGTTAAFLAEIFINSGYKTALYTSPHLINITERIKIDGIEIPEKKFQELVDLYLSDAKKFKLSFFEYLTAIAFLYFAEQKVDVAILETGLGGRLDATNVISEPLLSIITSIALDHQEILGKDIKKIAFEKAGIIKKDVPVICGKISKAALDIIAKRSKPLLFGKDFKIKNKIPQKRQFDYCGIYSNIEQTEISLNGVHQFHNAAIALCAMEVLQKKGYIFKNIKKALLNTRSPARIEIRKIKNKNAELIIDGAHNEHGISAFLDYWNNSIFSDKKRTFVFTMMKEKKYKKIIKKIAPLAQKVILVNINNRRALDFKTLKSEFALYMPEKNIFYADSASEALKMIKRNEKAAVVGSLYLAGEILKYLND